MLLRHLIVLIFDTHPMELKHQPFSVQVCNPSGGWWGRGGFERPATRHQSYF